MPSDERNGFYVASRASVPARVAMWKALRGSGVKINSSWIDEASPGQTDDFGELWSRIVGEIRHSEKLILYAEPEDFPLKGALVEVGIALAFGIPVAVVLPGVKVDAWSMRPIGSWARHSLVSFADSVEQAVRGRK